MISKESSSIVDLEQTSHLADVCKNYVETDINHDIETSCYLEVTLNFPRTSNFKNMSSFNQKMLYSKAFNIIKCASVLPFETEMQFEYCKSGHIHLHGLIYLKFSKKHYPAGVIADLCKAWYRLLPRVCKQFYEERHYYAQYERYKSPSITAQYTAPDDCDRILIWRKYMRKDLS